MFLLYSPLNQGLKPKRTKTRRAREIVFTLQSIKSRIETSLSTASRQSWGTFLLYSPLNQGLKLEWKTRNQLKKLRFLLYSPLNQGLKPTTRVWDCAWSECVFTLQSIKSRFETQTRPCLWHLLARVFTLQSIKSRIETNPGYAPPLLCPRFYSTVH